MFRQASNRLRQQWDNRQRYSTFATMPDRLLVFFAAAGFVVSSYYGWVLAKIVPGFLEIANRIPLHQWGWRGWLGLLLLAGLALLVWLFGAMAFRCNKLLLDRWLE